VGFLNIASFGITYPATDRFDATVVVKVCFPNAPCRRSTSLFRGRSRKQHNNYRSFVESFVAEAKSLARLVHPNIVGVHQVFEDNDTAYMAIDYIDGRDLHDILNSTDQAFTPDQVVAMLKKMLSAVEFIHQSGILHRDISPDNILVDKTGNPILIDFGAASEQVVRATRVLTGRRVIKEGYSPQEFYLTGAEQSPASDLYSLGAAFHHVIPGKSPPESQGLLARVAKGSGSQCGDSRPGQKQRGAGPMSFRSRSEGEGTSLPPTRPTVRSPSNERSIALSSGLLSPPRERSSRARRASSLRTASPPRRALPSLPSRASSHETSASPATCGGASCSSYGDRPCPS